MVAVVSTRSARAPRRELGDFQTPAGLVSEVLNSLEPIASRWPRVLEPTCGEGGFIAGLLGLRSPPREIQAIEIQPDYCQTVTRLVAGMGHSSRVVVRCANLFDVALDRDLSWEVDGPLLVVGNPPWVTSATLGRLDSQLQPPRRKDSGQSGLSARTGASNFDVAEAVWLELLRKFRGQSVTIALLCKRSVARRVLRFVLEAELPVADASIRLIDAAYWFHATVDACLLTISMKPELIPARRGTEIPVFSGFGVSTPSTVMGFWGSSLIADRVEHQKWEFADGRSPRTWRQGIKHDAAGVMELRREPGNDCWLNRSGEVVDVEREHVYPLVKAADLGFDRAGRPARGVIVTQSKIGADTTDLARTAPRLWAYLQSHAVEFARRKSSIYRGQPPFALFGIGPYTFAPYKVAISGLRKQPQFRALGLEEGKPVILDDASYLLPCATAPEAALLAAICNDPITLGLIRSAAFIDDKRPITKALLQRLDLAAVLERTDRTELLDRACMILHDASIIGTLDSLDRMLEKLEREFSKLAD
jgi:hypothetical protein